MDVPKTSRWKIDEAQFVAKGNGSIELPNSIVQSHEWSARIALKQSFNLFCRNEANSVAGNHWLRLLPSVALLGQVWRSLGIRCQQQQLVDWTCRSNRIFPATDLASFHEVRFFFTYTACVIVCSPSTENSSSHSAACFPALSVAYYWKGGLWRISNICDHYGMNSSYRGYWILWLSACDTFVCLMFHQFPTLCFELEQIWDHIYNIIVYYIKSKSGIR